MSLRIAMFSDNFYPELGGIQDSILANARELGTRGHQIRIYAPAAVARDYARVEVDVGEPDLGPGVSVHRWASVPVPSSSQQSRLIVPGGRRWREVAKFQPDLAHIHTFLGAGIEGRRTAQRLGVPLVGTNHWSVGAFDVYAPFARTAFQRMSSALVTRFYNHCDWVTAPSQFSIERMRSDGLSQPTSVISNPINTNLFRPVSESEKREIKVRLNFGSPTIVYAGRLGREKQVEVLLKAVACAQQKFTDLRFLIAGHGSFQASLRRLAYKLGIGESVLFLGTLKHQALAEILAVADVFAIASTSETQSMVMLQAMACSLPVVGARSGGLIEHIPSDTGFQAEPGSVTDFRDKLVAVLSDDSLRQAMGNHARNFAQSFSESRIADAWENLYTQRLRKRRTQATFTM